MITRQLEAHLLSKRECWQEVLLSSTTMTAQTLSDRLDSLQATLTAVTRTITWQPMIAMQEHTRTIVRSILPTKSKIPCLSTKTPATPLRDTTWS